MNVKVKKKLLTMSLLVILLAILASGTIAFFTAEDRTHNLITTGGIGVAIIEKTQDSSGTLVDFPAEGLTGIMPGSTASKIVSVGNTGEADAWIRVQVGQFITAADGTELPLTLWEDVPVMTFDLNTEDWIDGGDGWYYYRQPVAPGQMTQVLFNQVQFATLMGNAYQSCTANIVISAQAVQVANNGDTVLDAQGWPQEVTEG